MYMACAQKPQSYQKNVDEIRTVLTFTRTETFSILHKTAFHTDMVRFCHENYSK